MSYAELEQKYGEATLFKEDPPPSATPANEPFALPELPNPFGGGAAPPPKYDDAAPAPPEEEFKLPEISLPSFPNPFGGGAPAPREPVFADEEEDEPAAEEPFKLPEVKFPWQ